eukprot:12543905-Heterocapsa_arctica.AAC.1
MTGLNFASPLSALRILVELPGLAFSSACAWTQPPGWSTLKASLGRVDGQPGCPPPRLITRTQAARSSRCPRLYPG